MVLVPPPVELEGVVQNLLVRPLTTHVLRQVPLISLMRLHCERSFALTQKHALESLQSKSRMQRCKTDSGTQRALAWLFTLSRHANSRCLL